MNARLSLRRRPEPKPPPPGIVLSEASTDRRNFKLANVGQAHVGRPPDAFANTEEELPQEQREALITRHESDLAEHYKQLRARQIKIEELQREASERLLLAEKREAILLEKERFLQSHFNELQDSSLIERLKTELCSKEAESVKLLAQLEAANERIQKLETQRAGGSALCPDKVIGDEATFIPDPHASNNPFEGEERTPLIAEREAYIEASEEALLLKAQQLEELESHLRQWEEELESRARSA